MANLRWFRKNQKVLLTVFGVILMILFVVSLAVPYVGTSTGPSSEEVALMNQPVVKWSGGTLTRGVLQRMRVAHFAAVNLQANLQAMARKGGRQFVPVRMVQAIPENASTSDADRVLFSRFMLAEYAKKKWGLVISDDAVLEYLSTVASTEQMGQRELSAICRQIGLPAGFGQINEYLKMELAAMRADEILGESFFVSSFDAAPANALDAWQAYLQSEKQIECAVEEFLVADFLPQVPADPPVSDLRKIYESGKTQLKDPTGKKPGFKSPRKVRVEYLTADGAAFLERAIQDVTPEQVLAEYNRLVEAKDPMVMEPVTQPNLPLEEPLQDKPPAAADPAAPSDPAPAPASSGNAPAAETPAGEGGGEPGSAEPKATPPDPPGGNSPEESAGGGRARFALPRGSKYVSTTAGKNQDPAPAPDKDPEKPAETNTDPAAENAAKAAEPQEQPAQPAAAPAAESSEQDLPANAQSSDRQPKKLNDELELSIKHRLKQAEAQTALQAAVEKVNLLMREYSHSLAEYESRKSLPIEDRVEKPQLLDLAAIAAENHLKFGATGLCSLADLLADPFGQAIEFLVDRNTGQFQPRRIADAVFDSFDRPQLFSVEQYNSMSAIYLCWITEKVESRVPGFDEVKTDVLDYWKQARALELAQAAAQKLASELAGKKLAEEHKDKAVLTGSFRWLQANFRQATYGSPLGVKNAGEDFMKAAFRLTPDELGVAINDDRTAAYVIQLVTPDPRTDPQLLEQFLNHVATVRRIDPGSVHSYYGGRLIEGLVERMERELDVEWLVD